MKLEAFKNKVWLATPTMHGEEMKYVQQAYDTNWMSTVGENINEVERIAAENAEMNYAVGLACCTVGYLGIYLCKLFQYRWNGKGLLTESRCEL